MALDSTTGATEVSGGTTRSRGVPYSSSNGGVAGSHNGGSAVDSWPPGPLGAGGRAHVSSAPKYESMAIPPGENDGAGRGAGLEQRAVGTGLGIPGFAGGDVGISMLPGRDDGGGDQEARCCLLVFTDGESAGLPRNRRTAGESEEGEGPLRQPCDVAYWRGADASRSWSTSREKNGRTGSRVWQPQIPPWYRRYSTSSEPDGNTEVFLHKERLSPSGGFGRPIGYDPPNTTGAGRAGLSTRKNARPSGIQELEGRRREESRSNTRTGLSGEGGTRKKSEREPELGAFIVRETGIPGELQLLFVTKSKVPVAGPRELRL